MRGRRSVHVDARLVCTTRLAAALAAHRAVPLAHKIGRAIAVPGG